MATLKEKRTCGQRCEDFGRFVWNSDNGTLMGRTPEKWVYISLYYAAFYVVMTSLFSLAIWVLMYTLDPYAPDYQDRLLSPGVMVWPDKYGEEHVEITYNSSDKHSWTKMSSCLDTFLKPYKDDKQTECDNCTKGTYFFQKHFTTPNNTKKSCSFPRSLLGPCSGLHDSTFGYNCTMPCLIIKMNRIIGFLPSSNNKSQIHVNCTVLSGKENVKKIEYYPDKGIMDRSYFPYYGNLAQPHYLNPLVAVRVDLVGKQQAKLQCRVVADKISYQNFHEPYEGKVDFTLTNLGNH
ncbi:Potassium-transporting ATPase subunit beta [Merluccius polli]|uniref:Sodium/potassium-transporting ATPase subunit beta n=1 Tax=Merluccius polli TaxID=89951 RepID=A0AA47M5K9_MERPO|nr:Potassium-transporting ATPase subunit beta [Merluccius polli]KAK0148259.1 Potassium-transporting ATPase subunit beta [Merluccius polli]